MTMTTSRPQLHEQREIERLLLKLAKMKPISAKPAADYDCLQHKKDKVPQP